MRHWKQMIPPFIKRAITPLSKLYHQTTIYRNKTRYLGGRLQGYSLKGGLLRGFIEGTYENNLCTIIENNVTPGMVCVDVGAHVGYITLLFAKLTGNTGRVIAFEAHPTNSKYIKQNIEINKLADYVTVENIAINDGRESVVYLQPVRMRSMAEWQISNGQSNKKLSVPATSLDNYFQLNPKVDFVKMDIEGAEAEALVGMKELLTQSRPLLCIEFHHQNAWNARQILLDLGYRLYDMSKKQWIINDNFVYHCLAVPNEKVDQVKL